MKDEDNFEAASVENDISIVEQLLKGLSLKPAPESLNQSVKQLGNPVRTKFMHTWAGLLSLATASMLTGLLLGRFMVSNENPGSRSSAVSGRMGESTAKNLGKELPIRSSVENAFETKLDDHGLFFVNGTIPVRKYVAQSKRQFEVVVDSELGTKRTVSIPVRKTIFAPAPGI